MQGIGGRQTCEMEAASLWHQSRYVGPRSFGSSVRCSSQRTPTFLNWQTICFDYDQIINLPVDRNPAQRTHDDEDGGPLLIPGSTESDIWISWDGKAMPDSGDLSEELAAGRHKFSYVGVLLFWCATLRLRDLRQFCSLELIWGLRNLDSFLSWVGMAINSDP